MKKIAGLFSALASAVAVWAATEGTVAVEETPLNARKAPTVGAPVMMKLQKGTKVTIISRCSDNWLEIAVPQDAPVYVDEAYVVGGKASRDLRMYNGKGREHAVWGELKKGEAVTLLDDRARGWVRIAPPERLRLYVVALYVDGAEAVQQAEKPETPSGAEPAARSDKDEVKPAAVPAAKTEAKPAAKPVEKKTEAKPAAKPAEKKPAAKPAAKPAEKKPAAKPAAKPAEKKPAAKPAAKPAEKKPAAKPAAKPAEKKPAAKPAAKPAEKKPAVKPAAKLPPVKIDAALQELKIKETDKGKAVTRTGVIGGASDSFKAASFSLLDDRDENIGFVYYPGKASVLKKLVGKKVTIRGVEFKVQTWKKPVIVIQSLEVAP